MKHVASSLRGGFQEFRSVSCLLQPLRCCCASVGHKQLRVSDDTSIVGRGGGGAT